MIVCDQKILFFTRVYQRSSCNEMNFLCGNDMVLSRCFVCHILRQFSFSSGTGWHFVLTLIIYLMKTSWLVRRQYQTILMVKEKKTIKLMRRVQQRPI